MAAATARAGAGRVVVKVGSSSLTTAGRRPRRGTGRRARRRAGRGARRPAREVVLVSSGAIAAGLAPLRLRPAAARPGHPAGGGQRRPGPAGAPLHRGVRPARHHRRPGAADRRRRGPPRALPQRPAHAVPAARARRACRSSTRTTRWPPTRSGSATTTGWPRWSPTWCTPTCWCCSPTSTGSTTATRAGRRPPDRPRCAATPTWRASARPGRRHRRRHRRHGHQGRGRPDRHRRRHPGRAGRGRARPATALAGDAVGTFFHPAGRRLPTRLLWLAHATTARGRLRLDAGAVRAVVERRLSLLPGGRHRRSRATSSPATRSTSSTKTATWWPAGWSTLTRQSCPGCSAARPATSPGARAGVRPRGRPPRRHRAAAAGERHDERGGWADRGRSGRGAPSHAAAPSPGRCGTSR